MLRGGLLLGTRAAAGAAADGLIFSAAARADTEPFWGANQSGIVTDTLAKGVERS
jgi:hypothetical protein